MKLMGKLKKQVEQTSNKEEAKDIIAKAGIWSYFQRIRNTVFMFIDRHYFMTEFTKLHCCVPAKSSHPDNQYRVND